jgi:hypothetical protein
VGCITRLDNAAERKILEQKRQKYDAAKKIQKQIQKKENEIDLEDLALTILKRTDIDRETIELLTTGQNYS